MDKEKQNTVIYTVGIISLFLSIGLSFALDQDDLLKTGLRTLIALSAASWATILSGKIGFEGLGIKAAGALAVFVVVFNVEPFERDFHVPEEKRKAFSYTVIKMFESQGVALKTELADSISDEFFINLTKLVNDGTFSNNILANLMNKTSEEYTESLLNIVTTIIDRGGNTTQNMEYLSAGLYSLLDNWDAAEENFSRVDISKNNYPILARPKSKSNPVYSEWNSPVNTTSTDKNLNVGVSNSTESVSDSSYTREDEPNYSDSASGGYFKEDAECKGKNSLIGNEDGLQKHKLLGRWRFLRTVDTEYTPVEQETVLDVKRKIGEGRYCVYARTEFRQRLKSSSSRWMKGGPCRGSKNPCIWGADSWGILGITGNKVEIRYDNMEYSKVNLTLRNKEMVGSDIRGAVKYVRDQN